MSNTCHHGQNFYLVFFLSVVFFLISIQWIFFHFYYLHFFVLKIEREVVIAKLAYVSLGKFEAYDFVMCTGKEKIYAGVSI